MLRVGLTGGLGSGKTTVSALFATHGARILSADEIGREMMQPGNPVYAEIVHVFGTSIVTRSGSIDRLALARAAFSHGRIEELNKIVHPAVIAEEERRAEEIFERDNDAVVIVESALIFEACRSEMNRGEAGRGSSVAGWRGRFDKLILVTAPERLKLERFVARIAAGRELKEGERELVEADGRARIAVQIPDAEKAPLCDYVLDNSGPIQDTEAAVGRIWVELKRLSVVKPKA